ncbi:MAG: lysophospholipid acyltransferase family protein [Patescibacteria group bacterium]|nr:lysophospholipid acyltransferase family protein [Patescibacteria group bacterium]
MVVYLLQKMSWIILTPLFKIFLRLKVSGQENFNLIKQKQFIVIANHKGYLDPFLVSATVPFIKFLKMNFRYMTKPHWFKAYPIIKLLGAYKLERNQGSLEKTLASTEEFIRQGKHMLIFPEGTIPKQGEKSPTRQGIAYLAKKYNLPILPVALKGSNGINGEKGIDIKKFFSRKCLVNIKVGRPFFYADVVNNNMDYHSSARKIMELVRVML